MASGGVTINVRLNDASTFSVSAEVRVVDLVTSLPRVPCSGEVVLALGDGAASATPRTWPGGCHLNCAAHGPSSMSLVPRPVQLSQTVLELKRSIEPLCTPPCAPEAQKLVYKGKILKDADTLESYGAVGGGRRASEPPVLGTRASLLSFGTMHRPRGRAHDPPCQIPHGNSVFRYGDLLCGGFSVLPLWRWPGWWQRQQRGGPDGRGGGPPARPRLHAAAHV